MQFFSRRRVPQPDGGAGRRAGLPGGLRRALPQRQLGRRAARHPGPGGGRAGRAPRTPRRCCAPASPRRAVDGSVCVFLEPIALYHTRDLHADGDDELAGAVRARRPMGRRRTCRSAGPGSTAWARPSDLTIITFGNGVRMSLRVAARLADEGIGCRVVDLRWLAPLPVADIIRESSATGRVLVVDETRRSGGVGEGVLAALVDAGYVGAARRVAAVDSFVPLGPAARARAGRPRSRSFRVPAPCWHGKFPQRPGAPLARGRAELCGLRR